MEVELKVKDMAIATSINAIAFGDLEVRLNYANIFLLKMWGYDDEREVLGKPATKFWLEEVKVLKVCKIPEDE